VFGNAADDLTRHNSSIFLHAVARFSRIQTFLLRIIDVVVEIVSAVAAVSS